MRRRAEPRTASGRARGMEAEITAAPAAASIEDHAASADDADAAPRPRVTDFAAFYSEAYQGIARGLAITLQDADLAVEATDEGMARAYLHWHSVRSYDNPAGWVYRVGLNWARSLRRRLARRLPFRPVTEVAPPQIPDPAVQRALDELDELSRAVVVCRLLLDWSVADTAAALGLRPGTVKSRQHRALRLLETKLHHMR